MNRMRFAGQIVRIIDDVQYTVGASGRDYTKM